MLWWTTWNKNQHKSTSLGWRRRSSRRSTRRLAQPASISWKTISPTSWLAPTTARLAPGRSAPGQLRRLRRVICAALQGASGRAQPAAASQHPHSRSKLPPGGRGRAARARQAARYPAGAPATELAWRGTVERSGARLRLSLSQALLDLLAARPAGPALAFRSGEEQALLELALNEPNAEVARLQLSGLPRPRHQLHRARPARATRSRLARSGGRTGRAAHAGRAPPGPTDAWGEATFADVPLAALPVLQIEIDAESVTR